MKRVSLNPLNIVTSRPILVFLRPRAWVKRVSKYESSFERSVLSHAAVIISAWFYMLCFSAVFVSICLFIYCSTCLLSEMVNKYEYKKIPKFKTRVAWHHYPFGVIYHHLAYTVLIATTQCRKLEATATRRSRGVAKKLRQELIRRWDSERELLRSTPGRYANSLK